MSEAVATGTPAVPGQTPGSTGAASQTPVNQTPGATGQTTQPVVPNGATLNPDWTVSLAPDLKGYIETKGFKDAGSVVDAYRNLEKLRGVPQERLLKLPEDVRDPAQMAEIYDRLGRPKTADEYGLKKPVENDGGFTDWAKKEFYDSGLTKAQAETLNTKWGEYLTGLNNQVKTQYETKVAADATALKQEWGQAYDQNVNIAKNAAKTFGMTADNINALEATLGHKDAMKFLTKIAQGLGEDRFISGGGPEAGRLFSPDGAREALKQKMADKDWTTRYTAGGQKERQEFERLNKMIVGIEV